MIFKCLWLHFPFLSLFLYSQTLKADEVTVGSVLLITALPVLFSSHATVVAAGWAALQSSHEFQFSFGKPLLTKCPPQKREQSSSLELHHSPRSKGWRKAERCSRSGQFWFKPDLSPWMSDGDTSCEPFICTIHTRYEKTQISLCSTRPGRRKITTNPDKK